MCVVFLEHQDIITSHKKRAQDENPDERSVPDNPGEWIIVSDVRQAIVAGAFVRPIRPQLGMAKRGHEEHLRDERTLHSQKCYCHESADLQRRCNRSDATLQAGCAIHSGCHVVEEEGLHPEGDSIPLLGDPRRGQLQSLAERSRHDSGHPRDLVGIGRWYRKHFGATGAQVSSQSRGN